MTHEEREKCHDLPLMIGLYSDGFDPENPFKSNYAHDFGINKCYERLVNDLNSLIDNGIGISVCKSYLFRVAQYRADKKINLLMRLSENFANSK